MDKTIIRRCGIIFVYAPRIVNINQKINFDILIANISREEKSGWVELSIDELRGPEKHVTLSPFGTQRISFQNITFDTSGLHTLGACVDTFRCKGLIGPKTTMYRKIYVKEEK